MINYPFDESKFKNNGLHILVSAPGKVILHGEHSVVYGKLALAASVDLRTKFKISEIDLPNKLILQFNILEFTCEYDIQQINELLLKEPLPLLDNQKEYNLEFPNLIDHDILLNRVETFLKHTHPTLPSPYHAMSIKAFFYLLAGILGSTSIELTPILIVATTDLNIGAGLGSSASFAVSASAALLHYTKSKLSGDNFSKDCYKPCTWQLNLTKFIDKELDLISKWAFCSEKIIHGTPSGLDNTICTYGSVVEYRKGTIPKIMKTSCPLNLLLINSNVPRETKKLVAKVGVYHKKYPEIVDHMLDSMEAVSKVVLEKISELSNLAVTDDTTEIYDSLAELYAMNHNLLNAIGVGHRKLDDIVDILAQNGLSGKLTGGGGGGYAICLIPPNFDSKILEKTIKELESNGFGVIKTDLGVDGVRLDI